MNLDELQLETLELIRRVKSQLGKTEWWIMSNEEFLENFVDPLETSIRKDRTSRTKPDDDTARMLYERTGLLALIAERQDFIHSEFFELLPAAERETVIEQLRQMESRKDTLTQEIKEAMRAEEEAK